MENQAASESETITDIQNYLVSFNKEIQDGGHTVIQGTPAEGVHSDAPATAYYVAQAPATTEGFQYTEQAATQFEGGTFYTGTDGNTYYATPAGTQSSQVQYAYPAEEASQTYQTPDGLQQIVLAVNEANAISADDVNAQPQEIAVTLPETLTSQIAKAEANGTTQSTFVTMPSNQTSEDNLAAALMTESGQQTIRMVMRQPDDPDQSSGPTLITSDGQEIHVSDENTLQMISSLAGQGGEGGVGNNQVILNTGGSYQTVTIVPSDTNPGEVSYVLIVSQADDNKDDGTDKQDMSVYDFTEAEKQHLLREDTTATGLVDSKQRIVKMTQKKNTTISQAHMCNYCNYTSPKRYLLTRHMKSHSEERPHKCSVCERGFKTLASLQNHMNTHTGTRPHQCKDCTSCFTTSGELVRHVRYRHTHEKPHRCTECDYASVELSKLKRHMRCHTGERPYQCPHCTYASPDTYKLKRHLRIHTGEKPYECDYCHSRFTQSNSLKAHKLIHSGNKPVFRCEFCPTTCGRKTDLRIHVQKLHTSDRPLKCKRCGKSFPDRYTYKMHVKSHEGEKCFKCDLCNYASISHRHLESHMLIHTDQKPFRCDECNQSFRQKQLLKRHKNLYHDANFVPPTPREKTHECPECAKAFRHKGNLMRHMTIHDPEATADQKAEAMLIGQPKQPGELPDGEEDEYHDDDMDYMEMDESLNIRGGQEGQQVVVFEVIQLDEQQQAQMASLTGGVVSANGDPEGVAILQQMEGTSLADEVAAAVAQVHGEDPNRIVVPMGTPITATKSMPSMPRKRGRPKKSSLEPINSSIHEAKRRGRPKKHEYDSDVGRPIVVPITKVDMEDDDDDNMDEDYKPHHDSLRYLRKKKSINYEVLAGGSPSKKRGRGRPPKHHFQDDGEDDENYIEDDQNYSTVEIEDAKKNREEDLERKRIEEKEKDMAECFGFNDDEEEAETILAMPAAPGVRYHNGSE